ncbi:MAG: DUF4234 domain-containing protein [Candidatus Paraimprobicoccus trichonymphae]|uniref:DUF4234 domain-containing protein n=1 Tax=Candidatus Paraimprobicoccus trichonymphae TaxID=3033793 RepID=A0AA48IA01_9FIRM|nr:MAG: DUF4234 domain-containing protein [Candidatus Paraimprobicoccus trichonymphae]
MKKKSVTQCIILSLITCGIYGMFWYVELVDTLNTLTKTKNMSGISTLLLTWITCGTYGIYWAYQAGKAIDELKSNDGLSYGFIYAILYVFTGGIVPYAIIQNELNNYYDDLYNKH